MTPMDDSIQQQDKIASEEEAQSLVLETFPVGPLQCNCTIIGDRTTKTALVIDPGGDARKILALLKQHELQVLKILHTHAHFDHCLAAGAIHEVTGASIALHQEDKPLWDILERQCGMFGIPYEPVPMPHQWIEDEEEFYVNQLQCKAIHTPGHTPGSTSFSFETIRLLISGDTLFKRSVGRTDLWGGDFQKIERSIKNRLYLLDEATQVITGHGPSTSIGDEIRSNPYVRL